VTWKHASGAKLRLDYRYDAPDDPNGFFCRSDHYFYAQHGIPIAFFTTGEHADYHQVTDEVAYIDFRHLARVTGFVFDVVKAVGNLPGRLHKDSTAVASCN
jgi:hypothetical protein